MAKIQSWPMDEEIRYDGSIHPLVERYEYYQAIKYMDTWDSLEWRANLKEYCRENRPRQASVMNICRKDFMFWLSSFAYIIEPREGEEHRGRIPFVTWENQDPVFAAVDYYHGIRHIIGDKSRAQGASWMQVANYAHKFIFFPDQLLGMGSKNEEAADLPDNPDSLGWKFDFIMKYLPSWMRPPGILVGEENRKLGTHTWKNVLNGSTLKAYSATAGIGRSGRFTSFFLDESAFFPQGTDSEAVSNLLNTTNGLVMLSTPNGMNNEHYDRVHSPGPWLKVVLDWRDNPVQNVGKYTVKAGKLHKYDDYKFPDDYPYILDGRIRSPWYDRKWIENKGNALLVGQELDREYQGSKGRPFPKSALDRAKGFCREPLHTGMLIYDEYEPSDFESISWVEGKGYHFDLWTSIGAGCPPESKYVVSLDLATGTGGDTTSNSVIEVFDTNTRTQVAEFADNTIPPERMAELAVAVCYWFGNGEATPYLIWEKNGPGIRFTNEILRIGYPNIFYQKGGEEMRHWSKKTDKPGYHTSDTQLTLTPLISSLCACDATFYSLALLEECAHYLFNDAGKVENPRSRTSRDGGSRGLSHGDRAIAAALGVRAMNERKGNRGRIYTPENFIPEDIKKRHEKKHVNRLIGALARCKW